MKELMKYIHSVLSEYDTDARYQDLDRKEDGSIDLGDTAIVYNIEGTMYTGNEARRDIPLSIDIWYRKNKIYEVEDILKNIEEDFVGKVTKVDTGSIFLFDRASSFITNILDPNEDILRKRINFNIRHYE